LKIEDCVPTKEAAKEIGITYELLMSRIYKEKIDPKFVQKLGYAVFIHRKGVEIEKQRQIEWEKERDAGNKDLEKPTR